MKRTAEALKDKENSFSPSEWRMGDTVQVEIPNTVGTSIKSKSVSPDGTCSECGLCARDTGNHSNCKKCDCPISLRDTAHVEVPNKVGTYKITATATAIGGNLTLSVEEC